MKFNALLNGPGKADPAAIVARAVSAERDGWDVVSYADMAFGEPFIPLALVARETQRVELMTRIAGVSIRSVPLMASAAAWIDALSGGRFTLGLGASTAGVVEERHGMHFGRPAALMEDALRLIRGLHGDPATGVERGSAGLMFRGRVLEVSRAALDIEPARRVPIVIAASGPRMLRTAGAWADGVIVELATMEFVRWAWEQIRAGAATVGRDLAGFEFVYQSQMALISDVPADRERTWRRVDFLVNHMLQGEFDHMWKGGGLWEHALQVRAMVQAGDRAGAERLVQDQVLPLMSIIGERREIPARFRAWLDEMAAAGVTQVTLSLDLELTLGVSLAQARAHLARHNAAQ